MQTQPSGSRPSRLATILEDEFHSQLDTSGCAGGRDRAEGATHVGAIGSCYECRVRYLRFTWLSRLKASCPELDIQTFFHCRVLDEREVQVEKSRFRTSGSARPTVPNV
jgi:hypothetical protein